VAIETLGAWGSGALELVRDLGTRIALTTGDLRATTFLRQRLDVAIQRGNAEQFVEHCLLPISLIVLKYWL
jgi:hypothetical protein